jgi:ribosome biogenesis protein Tsr3
LNHDWLASYKKAKDSTDIVELQERFFSR